MKYILKELKNIGISKVTLFADAEVIEFYKSDIENNKGKNILISAHGNSIRALCKHLFNLDDTEISKLEIPTGNPLLIEFENNKEKIQAKRIIVFFVKTKNWICSHYGSLACWPHFIN